MFHYQKQTKMRNYFFIVTRCDSTKFIVTKKCDPTEVDAISASLASGNFSCFCYCLEGYKDCETFVRAILQELNSVDITDYDTYMKKVREEEELFEKFYDKVQELSDKAEDDDILLCEEVGGVYTTTDDFGNEVSKHVWVDYVSIDEWGEVSVYNSDDYSDTYLFSKLNKTAQVKIIKVFLRTIKEQDMFGMYGD